MPEIICVFQDCVMCGDRGKKLKQKINDKGIAFRKVSFASDEGKELCHKAVFEHNITTMPFFTDGKRFAATFDEIVAKPKKTAKKAKKIIDESEIGDALV